MSNLRIPDTVARKLEQGEEILATAKSRHGGFIATNKRLFRVREDSKYRILDYNNVSIKSNNRMTISYTVGLVSIAVIGIVGMVVVLAGSSLGIVTTPTVGDMLFYGFCIVFGFIGFVFTGYYKRYNIENSDVPKHILKTWVINVRILNAKKVNNFVRIIEEQQRNLKTQG